jgi:hypothetical protein
MTPFWLTVLFRAYIERASAGAMPLKKTRRRTERLRRGREREDELNSERASNSNSVQEEEGAGGQTKARLAYGSGQI